MSNTGVPKIPAKGDPFSEAAAKYERKQAPAAPLDPPQPVNRERELQERIARLEGVLDEVLTSLNGATIECVEGSVTLTLPDLPAAP